MNATWLLITSLVTVFSTAGYENFISAATAPASFAVGGMCLGTFIRLKKKEEKSLSIGCVFAQVIGGVTEPGLYGVGFGYKKPLIGMMIGGFTGALYGAIVGLTAYSMIPVASFLCLLSYTGGSTMNLINGIISAAIAFVVAALITYFFGFDKNKISEK